MATGRAKRAAAARARRGLALDKKPSALEVEKEVYRQSRKTAASKKASENKATKGRLPPNSLLREKKGKKKTNDQPGAIDGKKIQAKQIDAAIKGMELAGCPVPKGFELHMQLKPVSTNEKRKGKESNANNKNTNNKAGSQKIGGRPKIGGRGRGRGRNNWVIVATQSILVSVQFWNLTLFIHCSMLTWWIIVESPKRLMERQVDEFWIF